MERIPESFESVNHYLGSYVYPLSEETRAQIHSSMEIIWRAPFAEVISFEESKPYGTKVYEVKVDLWRNRFRKRGKEPYKTLPGVLFILGDAKPETVSDLQMAGRSWAFVSVSKILIVLSSKSRHQKSSNSTMGCKHLYLWFSWET